MTGMTKMRDGRKEKKDGLSVDGQRGKGADGKGRCLFQNGANGSREQVLAGSGYVRRRSPDRSASCELHRRRRRHLLLLSACCAFVPLSPIHDPKGSITAATMSGFSVENLERKFAELNNSQQMIQTLSLWLIHYRKHCQTAVQTWIKFLRNHKSQAKKLTLLYLANDVIQNSRKKGPEYMNEFAPVLKQAFESIVRYAFPGESVHVDRCNTFLTCTHYRTECDDKTWASIDRIIKIWEQRNIYGHSRLSEFKQAIGDRRIDSTLTRPVGKSNAQQQAASQPQSRKSAASQQQQHVQQPAEKKLKTVPAEIPKNRLPDLPEARDNVVIDSESLLRALSSLESCASADKEVREKIAGFPPEVTDVSLIERISGDKGHLMRLQRMVEEACILLSDYNHKLSQEMEDRKTMAVMLATYVKNQKDRLAVTEATMSEYRDKLTSVTRVRSELRSHLQNLPDLSLLPSVLTPLPSAGDLFNVHNVHVTDVRQQLMNSKAESTSSASPATSTYSPADHDFPTPKS